MILITHKPKLGVIKQMRIVIKSEDKNILKNAVQAAESSEILGESHFDDISIYRIKENVTFDSAISSNLAQSLPESFNVVGSKLISIEVEDAKIKIEIMEDMNMAFWQQYKLFRNDTVRKFNFCILNTFNDYEKSATV